MDSSFLAFLRIFLDFILSQLLTDLFTSYRITHLVPKVSFGVLSTQKGARVRNEKKSESVLRSCHDTHKLLASRQTYPSNKAPHVLTTLPNGIYNASHDD
jgi:hypothetical protein